MREVIDVEELRSWIGREEVARHVVTPDHVERFRATLDLPGGEPCEGEVAPPLVHFCFSFPVVPTASLGEDGHPGRGVFLPPIPLPRRMWAGSDIAFGNPIKVGDKLHRTSRIADVIVKSGRTGTLCFVAVTHRLEANGEVAIEERQDIVYRRADATPVAGGEPVAKGRWTRAAGAPAHLLFRYSAVTFNGHRIHYDRRYVTDIEPYPGLVVHGPLQATMLINYASEIRGSAPSHFRFRSNSPLFDIDSFSLNAKETKSGLQLWTAREDGPAAMLAEAEWR